MCFESSTIRGKISNLGTFLLEQFGLTAFDAYHLAYADHDPIISSDNPFGDVTDARIPIERQSPK